MQIFTGWDLIISGYFPTRIPVIRHGQNRKEYVARIITGKEYDVIGIQEMKKVQYNDLKSLLPDYGLEYWGRDSHLLSDVGEGVGVAWQYQPVYIAG